MGTPLGKGTLRARAWWQGARRRCDTLAHRGLALYILGEEAGLSPEGWRQAEREASARASAGCSLKQFKSNQQLDNIGEIMNIEEALNGVEAFLTAGAKAIAAKQEADGLVKHYEAKKHSGSAGKYIAACLAQGLVLDAMGATMLFHSMANHSAWRQKFEKAGIFPAAVKEAKAGDGATAAPKTAAEKAKAKFLAEFGE